MSGDKALTERERWLRFLGAGSRLESSFLPGRAGFVLTSKQPLSTLHCRLVPHWARRVLVLHQPSGRYWLEPSRGFLLRALLDDRPSQWWTAVHQQGARSFFLDFRRDRLFRLSGIVDESASVRVGQEPAAGWTRGYRRQLMIALRLEALHVSWSPLKAWAMIAKDFDKLWETVALYRYAAFDPQLRALVGHLAKCWECYQAKSDVSMVSGLG